MVGQERDVLEVGCGNGEHLRDLAARNRSCVGVDISDVVLDPPSDLPANVELMVADAVDLSPLPARRFDVVFSSQLIEHLHPDDVPRHLHEVARVLRPGGRYIFETPNRLGGPHDVSRHFDDVATCFHLREYTNGELLTLLRQSGFRKFRSPLFRNRAYRVSARLARLAEIPTDWKVAGETAIAPLPVRLRRRLAKALKLNILIEAIRG
jgi:SAM-dependent methyltransferase